MDKIIIHEDSRSIDAKKSILSDIRPGDYILYPRNIKFINLELSYRHITEEMFLILAATVVCIKKKTWTFNKALVAITSMDKNEQVANGIYKHNDQHFMVSMYHSEEYIKGVL